jgi:hypothetical protein
LDTVGTRDDPFAVAPLKKAAELPGQKIQEDIMAKGQMRSTKEKKKPKAEWNKKKKGGPAPSPFALGQGQSKTDPYAKKG